MKKPKCGGGCDHRHEGPTRNSSLEAKTAADSRPFDEHAETLEHEVGGWEPVTSSRRKGDDGFVDQARNQKNQKHRRLRPGDLMQWPKYELVGKLAEAEIPTLSPKFTQ